MPRRKKSLIELGETELEVLQHIWSRGEATVSGIHEQIAQGRPVAYTTVMTVMKNLAGKGYLAAHREGVRDHYRAVRSEEHVRERVLQTILDKLFDGSPVALVRTLVKQQVMSTDEIATLQFLIGNLATPEPQDG